MTLCEKIVYYRDKNGWTQKALAAADGRSLSNYITRILEAETQKNAPAN